MPLQQSLTSLRRCLKLSLFRHSTFAFVEHFQSKSKKMKTDAKISTARINRIRAQGYTTQTNQEISELAFGNRFTFQLCTALLTIGVATASIPVLSVMFILAMLGVILPNHPFDYIYNYAVAPLMHKPKLPKRSPQLKFACSIASFSIAAIIALFYTGNATAGYVIGGMLIAVALTVATFDFCIPSMIYNALFPKIKKSSIIS
jgi:hypothetical protein